MKIIGELTQLLTHDEIYETLKYPAGHGFINHESSSKVIPFRFSKLTSRKSIFLDLFYLSDTNDGLVDPSWSSCFQSLRKKDSYGCYPLRNRLKTVTKKDPGCG